MRALLMISAALFAVASSAAAQPAVQEKPTQPVRFAPNEPRYARLGPVGPYYPERAAARRLGGEAVIDCSVGEKGALDKCVLVSETPARQFFGAAALRMAQTRWISADPSQVRIGETARFVVPFQPAERPEASR